MLKGWLFKIWLKILDFYQKMRPDQEKKNNSNEFPVKTEDWLRGEEMNFVFIQSEVNNDCIN